MSDVGHDLHHAFPSDREILHLLKHESVLSRTLSEGHHHLAEDIARTRDALARSEAAATIPEATSCMACASAVRKSPSR